MYFVVNKDNIIIAISQDLKDKLKVDNLCMLSTILEKNLIEIEEDKKEIKISNFNQKYKYIKNQMISFLGELYLYQIITDLNEEKENQEDIDSILNLNENLEKVNNLKENEKELEFQLNESPADKKVTLEEINILDESLNKKSQEEEINLENSLNIKESIEDIVLENKESEKKSDIPNSIADIKLEEKRESKEDELKIPDIPLEALNKEKELEFQLNESPADKKVTLEEINILDESLNKKSQEEEIKKEDKKGFFSKKIFPWGKKNKNNEEEIANIENLNIEVKNNSFNKDAKDENKEEVKQSIRDFSTLEEKLLKDEEELLENQEDKIKDFISNLNLEKNAKNLNLNLNSYKMLLKSYLEELNSNLKELENGNENVKNMLIDASKLLSLEAITNELLNISNSIKTNKDIINRLEIYSENINRILSNDKKVKTPQVNDFNPINNENQEKDNIIYENKEDLLENKEEELTTDNILDINDSKKLLEQIKAQSISIDFEEIAKSLNLPKELIIEFIKDFLEQTKEHLKIFIDEYNKKDLEEIHNIAHMLKGAANNLRLNSISETLAKLQSEKNFDEISSLIKIFASQIKGLEEMLKNLGE